ncbi:MAG: hypothetical protein EBQ96_09590 [Proteobacteria bacterium]|nr:hypothetical protein [Pseudomonadota bacterium]
MFPNRILENETVHGFAIYRPLPADAKPWEAPIYGFFQSEAEARECAVKSCGQGWESLMAIGCSIKPVTLKSID